LFMSDGNDRPENYSASYDGFYVDDFKIIGINEASTPPTAVCQDITVELDANGMATITGIDVDGGSTDDVGITNRSLDISSFSCSDVGNIVTVTLTVTDANGQTDQCTAAVTVVDAGAPEPDLASLPVIDTFCIINLSDLSPPTATDACEGQIIASTSTAFPITTSGNILWEYTDSSGNSITQSQMVSIPMPQCLPGGLAITALDTRYAIDFDNTLSGVNNGQFSGAGFSPNPNPGQLNSEAFEVLGLNAGPSLFGDTQTGVSFANGTSNGFTDTGGIFAFQVSPNNYAFGVQPANNEFNTNGRISLRIKNNTSSTVNTLLVGYTIWINNDQNRASTFNFSHSSDNVNLIAEAALNTASVQTLDNNGWTAYYRVIELTGLNIPKDNTYFLHWTSNDNGGNGPRRDEFALDDIHIVANPVNTTPAISGVFKEVLLEGSTTATAQTDINEFLILNAGQLTANGLVTLKSNNTTTAIIPEVLNGIVNGAIEVERYIPAKRAFRFLSSPVTTTDGIFNNWQESGNNVITNWGTQITGSGGAVNGFDVSGSNNPSMFGFDNVSQTWTTVTNTLTTNLTAGTPYRIMVRGDRSINLFSNASPPTTTTLRAKGALHIGDYVVPSLSSAADGFNFIGNPYQASVDMQLVLTEAANIKNSFYTVWDPTINIRGGYVTVDVVNNINPVSGSVANKFLQPGQAAFVQTNTPGTATLTFKEIHKDNAIDYVAVFNQVPAAKITLNVFNTANSSSALDAVQLRFSEVYNNSVDQYDAGKIFNQDETFALLNNSDLLSIESRANPMNNDTIPLFTDRYRFTNYKLELKGEAITGFDAYLWDDYEKVLTAIPANSAVMYNFDVDATIPESIATQRFYIITSPQTLSVDPFDVKELTLYPNPVSTGQVFIEAGFNFENAQIQVYNTLGQEVLTQTYESSSSSLVLDVQKLASGTYMLNISDNSGLRVIKKLIVR
ncbi:MAG: T9SS type A sorting domain-containing protein, partial [Flavobacteriaceae bacterium]|nr:T9SS type A sorting domain-containing protein [Flavobacteriaceae bacterium]